MPRPITKTPDETIKEVIEQTALKTAKLFRDESSVARNAATSSRISQIVKTANSGSVANLAEEAARAAVEKEKEEMERKTKEETERREKEEKDRKEKEEREEKERKEKEKKNKAETKEEQREQEGDSHDDDLLCPSCHKGHVHKLKGTPDGKVKCTGPGCETVYNLVPESADYKCESCGSPHKRPTAKELEENDECPFCGGDRFRPYDWSRLKKKVK